MTTAKYIVRIATGELLQTLTGRQRDPEAIVGGDYAFGEYSSRWPGKAFAAASVAVESPGIRGHPSLRFHRWGAAVDRAVAGGVDVPASTLDEVLLHHHRAAARLIQTKAACHPTSRPGPATQRTESTTPRAKMRPRSTTFSSVAFGNARVEQADTLLHTMATTENVGTSVSAEIHRRRRERGEALSAWPAHLFPPSTSISSRAIRGALRARREPVSPRLLRPLRGPSPWSTRWGRFTRWKLFDLGWDPAQCTHALIGQEQVQRRIYRSISSFVREGRPNRPVLMHGPNGSAETSIVMCVMRGSTLRSTGRFHRLTGLPVVGRSRGSLGFGNKQETPRDPRRHFAHLPDDGSARSSRRGPRSPAFLIRSTSAEAPRAPDEGASRRGAEQASATGSRAASSHWSQLSRRVLSS